jgi:hypothetical protein
VIHSQQHPLLQQQQQPSGNLMINIPTSSAAGHSVASPRMQVKQVIQRSTPSQVPSSIPTVVMKAGQPHPHHIVTSGQDPKGPTYIQQGTKVLQAPPDGCTYISGGREIIYVGGGKQTIYPNYPNKYQPVQTPTQQKPLQVPQQPAPKIVEKIPTQPSVSVTHIQMPPQHQPPQQQQKVYFTNSGQVLTNVPSSAASQHQPQVSESNDRPQQWVSHEKIPSQSQPQPLKNRYIETFDEVHRAQMQSERAQQVASQSQGAVKRSYVIDGPGSHALPSPSQPAHHTSTSSVNQPIIPPQNKTVIGLNQAPQILTGAVASPPLKAHLTSQQPIVTGKFGEPSKLPEIFNFNSISGASSSRVAIPPISPKDQHHHPRHFPPEGYEDSVMVSLKTPTQISNSQNLPKKKEQKSFYSSLFFSFPPFECVSFIHACLN